MKREEYLEKLEKIKALMPAAVRQSIQNGKDPEKAMACYEEIMKQLSELESDIKVSTNFDELGNPTVKK